MIFNVKEQAKACHAGPDPASSEREHWIADRVRNDSPLSSFGVVNAAMKVCGSAVNVNWVPHHLCAVL